MTETPPMNQAFSQMALDFPMEAEPKAPPQDVVASRHGAPGNILSLSEEEEHAVREGGRRAGVVVRIKTLKKGELPTRPGPLPEPAPILPEITPEPEPIPEPGPLPKPEPQPGPIGTIAAEKIIQPSIQLEEIELTIVRTEISEPAAQWQEPAADRPIVVASVSTLVAKPEVIIETIPDPPLRKPAPRERSGTAPVEKVKSKRGRKSLKQVAAEADLIEIPEDEVLFSKHYYTMGEVAEMFRVNQSLLRFWETEFSILQPKKNKKGDRYFRPVDIKNLHLIYHLLRQRKYTIEGAKEFLRKNKTADQRFEAIRRLQQIRAFLLELKAQL